MKTKKRQKLCYNCEGEVDLDVIVCPFCAADLREEKPEQRATYDHSESLKNLTTQQSLYPPNYAPKAEEPIEEEPIIQEVEEESEKSLLGPLFLLSFGSQLFLLGALMLFFSKNGQLHLQWDARFWFFYLLASIPLLVFGYRSLK